MSVDNLPRKNNSSFETKYRSIDPAAKPHAGEVQSASKVAWQSQDIRIDAHTQSTFPKLVRKKPPGAYIFLTTLKNRNNK